MINNRAENLKTLEGPDKCWDVAVIGGGSSGLGVALDAISRGLSVVLLEKSDFAKGTSSRSTKLLHGGVRYLAQGDVFLVLEALRERGKLLANAPHITTIQPFIIPLYSRFNVLKYTIGLKVYDWMSINWSIGTSEYMNKATVLAHFPNIRKEGLRGGVLYYDGQFDDARLAINLMQTIMEHGGTIVNYMEVKGLSKNSRGKISGIEAYDRIGKKHYTIAAKMIVNATGVFADKVLRMDVPEAKKMIQPSQGVHIVLDQSFLSSEFALMIPKTSDGRVLFAVPWQDKLVVGTTDTLRKKPKLEPEALQSEINFILKTAKEYMVRAPQKKDVLAVFAGLRPLAAPEDEGEKTKEISRSHKVIVSKSNLVTLTGGKWTTFRKMGEDTMEQYEKVTGEKPGDSTSSGMAIHGYTMEENSGPLAHYGIDISAIVRLQKEDKYLLTKVHHNYDYTLAEVSWAVEKEMAVTVEDMLSRRVRLLLQDVEAAIEAAPLVARHMATCLGEDQGWINKQLEKFNKLANKYRIKLD
jgi:glycerol-3-phosphate dehydrogenase